MNWILKKLLIRTWRYRWSSFSSPMSTRTTYANSQKHEQNRCVRSFSLRLSVYLLSPYSPPPTRKMLRIHSSNNRIKKRKNWKTHRRGTGTAQFNRDTVPSRLKIASIRQRIRVPVLAVKRQRVSATNNLKSAARKKKKPKAGATYRQEEADGWIGSRATQSRQTDGRSRQEASPGRNTALSVDIHEAAARFEEKASQGKEGR